MHEFTRLGELAKALTDKHCNGSLLLIQEGGCQISYAVYCLHATLEGVPNENAKHSFAHV